MYICSICSKKYKSITWFLFHTKNYHINNNNIEKNKVENINNNNIEKNKIYNCRFCNSNYKFKQSRWIHEKSCKEKNKPIENKNIINENETINNNIINENETINNNIINENETINNNIINKPLTDSNNLESNINNTQTLLLIEQIKILSQKVNELTESNKKNKSININTTNNTIIINGVGKEDISFLSLEDKQNIMKTGLNSIFKLIEKLNFNSNKPENHNFCVTSINDKHASVINPDNNKIIKADKSSLFDTVAINNFKKLESIANNPDFTDSENNLYNNEISKLKDMLFINSNGLKIFHSEINILSYNNKDIILDTWKNLI